MDSYKITKEYYTKRAEYHSEVSILYDWENQINKFVNGLEGKLILDAGCGRGRDIKKFQKKGYEVESLDYSPEMIELCRKQYPSTKFIVADLRKTGQPSEHYPGIWACASILHLKKEDAKDALKEFHRILKPNGKLFISVKKGTEEKLLRQKNRQRFFKFYTKNELKDFLENNGFNVKEIEIKKYEELAKKEKGLTDHNWICAYAEKNEK